MRVTDPECLGRCQAVIPSTGQCMEMAETGDYCRKHAGASQYRADKNEVRNYRLGKFQARVEQFADSDKIKSLREEIGLVRMIIEEVVNRCNNSTELILMSGKISSLITQAEKLVNSCHRLEQSTGLLLDKTAILQLAGLIIEIINAHVHDEAVMQDISDKIITAIVQAQPAEPMTKPIN